MVCSELADVAGSIGKLAGLDAHGLSDPESIEVLYRLGHQLEAIKTKATAAFDAEQRRAPGAKNASSWIAAMCSIPIPTAKSVLKLGRGLRHMALTAEAFSAGEISRDHARVLNEARMKVPAAFARDEKRLVDDAIVFVKYRHFKRAIDLWLYENNEDGAEANAAKAYDDRKFFLSRSFENKWFSDGLFDPIGGEIFHNELMRIYEELFQADWAEAKERVGEHVSVNDLRRAPAQRRADAVVEMARRSAAMPADARMPAPLFSVFVGYETLAGRICELASGITITPGALLPWLSEAYIERIVFDTPSRVIDVGQRERLFKGAKRRAVQARDRECYDELCDERIDRCQVDHIQPYSQGGLTVEENGRLACGFHNRRRNGEDGPAP